jgi:hypothetical protein
MSDMKIAAGFAPPSQMAAELDVLKNAFECLVKLAQGDLAGAAKEFAQACDALKQAAQGGQQAAPGQGLDLYALLREILEQGKKASQNGPSNQGNDGMQGAQACQQTPAAGNVVGPVLEKLQVEDPQQQQPQKQADAPEQRNSPVQGKSQSAEAGKAPDGVPQDMWNDDVEVGKKTGIDPYVLAAQEEKESQFGKALAGSPSGGDGVLQVEPSTRQAYAAKFEAKMGHAYDHSSQKDQIAMAAVIEADKGGSTTNMLEKYNGGDNWAPGATDSYGRQIKADEYAASVTARAEQMKAGG